MSVQFRRVDARALVNPRRRAAHLRRERRERTARWGSPAPVRPARSLRRTAARVHPHRRRQLPAHRTRKGAAQRSLVRLPTGMDSDPSRRHHIATRRVESRVRRLVDRLVDSRNVAAVEATGTGLLRVPRERVPVVRIRTATGADHPRESVDRRVRNWICGSQSCAVRPPAAIARRATADRIARPAAAGT